MTSKTPPVPNLGTLPRMARPRGEIPEEQAAELIAARDARATALDVAEKAEARFRAAVDAAYQAGGSHTVIANTAQIAKSTVQKYVTPRREQP